MMLHHRALSSDCFPKSSHLHFLNNNKNPGIVVGPWSTLDIDIDLTRIFHKTDKIHVELIFMSP